MWARLQNDIAESAGRQFSNYESHGNLAWAQTPKSTSARCLKRRSPAGISLSLCISRMKRGGCNSPFWWTPAKTLPADRRFNLAVHFLVTIYRAPSSRRTRLLIRYIVQKCCVSLMEGVFIHETTHRFGRSMWCLAPPPFRRRTRTLGCAPLAHPHLEGICTSRHRRV